VNQMTKTQLQRFNWMPLPCWTVCLALCLIAGCKGQTVTSPASDVKVKPTDEGDMLSQAFGFIERLAEFESKTVNKQINYFLSRWLSENKNIPLDWKMDEFVAKVPEQAAELVSPKELKRKYVSRSDVRYVKECIWMRIVAKWAIEHTPKAGLIKLQTKLTGAEANQLREAKRLFQWTMRNVQLKGFPRAPKTILAGTRKVEWPSRRSVAGPGYEFFPWQVVMQGVGDTWQRARVFMLLLRQRGIDSVMLGVDETEADSAEPKFRYWAPAVMIGQQLYLFDTKLGIPLPGKVEGSIATLEEVNAHPEILSDLDVGSLFTYPTRKSELSKVVALLNISPDSLGRRWYFMESRLAGKHKTVLTQSPTRLRNRLQKCKGVKSVHFWRVPFETIFYRRKVQLALENPNSGFSKAYYQSYGVFERFGPLVQARLMHLSGIFDKTEERKMGAKSIYMTLRVSDFEVQRLHMDRNVQEQHGVIRQKKHTNEQWRSIVMSTKLQMIVQKMHASYWIGLIHFESGKLDAASQWFSGRLLEKYKKTKQGDPCIWRAGAIFNLGRTYEAMGKIKEARRTYLEDETLGRHGSLVRARMLRKFLKPEKAP